jgi:hypothetical protein
VDIFWGNPRPREWVVYNLEESVSFFEKKAQSPSTL